MKITLLTLNIITLTVSILWVLSKPGWDSLVACLGLIATLIAQICSDKTSGTHKTIMKQKGGNNSINYQSNGNINIDIKK